MVVRFVLILKLESFWDKFESVFLMDIYSKGVFKYPAHVRTNLVDLQTDFECENHAGELAVTRPLQQAQAYPQGPRDAPATDGALMTFSKTEVKVCGNHLLDQDRQYVEAVSWCLFTGHGPKKEMERFQWPMVHLYCLKLHIKK